ncbi:hypothetical protein [Pseudomonas sp. Sample_9]|uniref:hypothetical protein n=1 Tax=Pseudomonas sp. Sample_9 TaxID=2382158 RepID=UPI001032EC8C|nr:hypothetical protein [Pseudomonas sp. Sample_9]
MTVLSAADLFRPRIPLATELETPEEYHGGISLEAVKSGYLTGVVDPWLNMALKDKCAFYFDNPVFPVRTIEIDENNINKQLTFDIPAGQITNGSANAFYIVTRLNQGPVESDSLLLWVKLTRPGDVDTDSEPGHSGLLYTLDPDPSKGVDADMARGGIKMLVKPYKNIATHDRMFCRWGDELVSYYPVTEAQVADPANNPIIVTFTEEVIKKEGSKPLVEVSFQVVDRVGNFPDPEAPWSKITNVSVDLTDRLPAPLVMVDEQIVSAIDLKQLGRHDAVARAFFTDQHFQINDELSLTWTGIPPQGQPVIVGPAKKKLLSLPNILDLTIPNAAILLIRNGSAKVSYDLIRGDLPARQSREVDIKVTGEVSQLEPPTVTEAPNLVLDPNVHQNGFTVVFDNLKLNANDEIELEVVGRPGDGSVPPQKKVIVAGQTKTEFKIPYSITGANLQLPVVLKYSVISSGQGTPVQSVELKIGELLQSSMPMPKLEGFDGDVLDVGLIKDDTKVLCEAWPLQCAKGCPIWLKYVETFAGGGERVKEQFVGAAHDQEVGLSYLAEVEWLRGCKADSKLVVVLKVGLYSGTVESEAVGCRVRSYVVKAGLDDLTTFDNYDWNHWAISASGDYQSKISNSSDEFFLESLSNTGSSIYHVWISKSFQGIETGTPLEFSCDCRSSSSIGLMLVQNNEIVLEDNVPSGGLWQKKIVAFYASESPTPNSLMLVFHATSPHTINMKNLRIKHK